MSGSAPDGADAPLDRTDLGLLAEIAAMFTERDPVPPNLADRVLFALQLDDLEMELAQLQTTAGAFAGARAEEHARTVTFASENLTVMVTMTPTGGSRFRLDGWAAPGGDLPVELRLDGGTMSTTADADGRFEFPDVPPGRFQLVLHPAEGSGAALRLPVVTPAVEL